MSELWQKKKYIGLHVKFSLFLPDFNETWIFSTYFRKNPQISKFMKNRPVGGELLSVDGRTDMTELIVAFRSFANAPKKMHFISCQDAAAWSHPKPF